MDSLPGVLLIEAHIIIMPELAQGFIFNIQAEKEKPL